MIGVAGIAAYVSYWHAYDVVRAHGENGVTARLEPATIDGLVYSSSMVVLYAARHRLAVPALARWLLVLGIAATLAANMAHGWSHGPVGATVAAWPAASLVGSYELLLWLIRTAGPGVADGDPVAIRAGASADGPVAALRLAPGTGLRAAGCQGAVGGTGRPGDSCIGTVVGADQPPGPRWPGPDQSSRFAGQAASGWPGVTAGGGADAAGADVNSAAVAAYRASLETGAPLSERKLAAMFGKTSRRWARNRMADA